MNGGGRSNLQPPNVSNYPPARPTLPPPFTVALDGKTLRRSYDRAEGSSPLHLVNAWAAEQRLVLGQQAVAGKSNEITAIPQLLKMLSLAGTVVTADACTANGRWPSRWLNSRRTTCWP